VLIPCLIQCKFPDNPTNQLSARFENIKQVTHAPTNLFEKKRLRTDILLCFKIVNIHAALDFQDLFELDFYNTTRGHNFKLKTPNSKATIRQQFFCGILSRMTLLTVLQ